MSITPTLKQILYKSKHIILTNLGVAIIYELISYSHFKKNYFHNILETNGSLNVLRDVMGFIRNERLNVKNPDLPSPPKLNIVTEINEQNLSKMLHTAVVIKKKEVLGHSEDKSYASYSVDTEFCHVILKNP